MTTGQPFRIAPVSASDVPELVALVTEVLGEHGLEFGKGSPTDTALLSLPDSYTGGGGAFWIARSVNDDILLGTCGAYPIDATTTELRKMYLRPAARGLGLGRAFLDTVTKWAKDAGAECLVLDTFEGMERAIAFYEAHGFQRDDSQIRGARCTRGYRMPLR